MYNYLIIIIIFIIILLLYYYFITKRSELQDQGRMIGTLSV